MAYRLLAMTFGRPTMVNKSFSTPVPAQIDDEYLQKDGSGTQPPSSPSRLGLFVFSCKLFEILADILSTSYAGRTSTDSHSESSVQDLISDVLSFNRRLDDFIVSLPGYLNTTRSVQVSVNEKNSHINLQQQVLYCR